MTVPASSNTERIIKWLEEQRTYVYRELREAEANNSHWGTVRLMWRRRLEAIERELEEVRNKRLGARP